MTMPANIQFYDGYFPALDAGSYSIGLTQTLTTPDRADPSYMATRTLHVVAPQFAIDPGTVHTAYPPPGATGTYDQELPFVVLGDPELPWERALTPGGGAPDSSDPLPWIALVILADGEIHLQRESSNPVLTTKVEDLLNGDTANVLGPQIPTTGLSPDVLASQCQTITIPGAVFNAVMPTKDDLRYLAHCRSVDQPEDGGLLLSVVLANRLPLATTAPLRWYAQLVSVEGFQDYLGPGAQPIPRKQGGSEPKDVRLVSLAGWSFISQPQSGLSFKNLLTGLIASEQATAALRLPIPAKSQLPQAAAERLEEGYAPIPFVTGASESSFAWYRGPFTPLVPQPLPQVGDPPVEAGEASTADQLMIYLAKQGLFDLSYAAAWNIGRQLALADAQFAQAIGRYYREARGALGRLAQGMVAAHLAGVRDPHELLAHDPSRRRFLERVGGGLPSRWTRSMAAARAGKRPPAGVAHRVAARAAIHPASVLEHQPAVEALGVHLDETAGPVAAWLAKLSLLGSVPFSHLVPDPRMLPPESIRFFYVDQGWIDALIAGATSLAVHSSADVALLGALRPRLRSTIDAHRAVMGASPGGTAMTGLLIRSALVSGWPALVVRGTVGGAPLPVVRDDRPAPSVRVCLFEGVPDEVSLAEPYEGLRFGLKDRTVGPRNVTAVSVVGAQIANLAAVAPSFRQPPAGVLEVASLASTLAAKIGLTPFGPNAKIHWNGTALPTTVVSPSRLEASVPASLIATPGTASITVLDGGVVCDPTAFTIDPPLAIDSLQPFAVAAGGDAFTLHIDGVGFAPNALVKWNGAPLETKVLSRLEATAAVTAELIHSPGKASITVVVDSDSTPATELAILAPGPAISRLEPNIAPAGGSGLTLTVLGSGFAPGAAVEWNGTALLTAFAGDGQLSAPVPAALIAAPGTTQVTVASGGLSSNAVPFTIGPAGPRIGSFEQAVAIAGGEGFELVVRGINFGADAVVRWNGNELLTTRPDASQLSAQVPANLVAAGSASVTVASDGQESPPARFAVIAPQPAIGLLEPRIATAEEGGFTLSVTGGFGAGDFAIQMVATPELQSFRPDGGGRP